MTPLRQLILGSSDFAFERGQSVHGRWRAGYARAAASAVPAALALTLDAARLVFVLAEGPAALDFAGRLGEALWTLEAVGDEWPVPLVTWLDDGDAVEGISPEAGALRGRTHRPAAAGQLPEPGLAGAVARPPAGSGAVSG
ncbi:MAG: hypothetical protein KatS3mg051_0659 [Anaerolineae bacterium]|nr:MAG: hypothetical protein KatS3mg051_0659 [Anaerolineae bacterium]